jgi:catechol 2,3-dioxygenase-like lactoylglutathione lyase family enzyme
MSDTPFQRIDTVFVKLDDPHAAAGWYSDVLGWPELFRTDYIVVLRSPDGPPLTLLNPAGGEWSGFNFYAPDAQAAHAWLVERGVEVGPLTRAGDQPVTWFWFRDPQGNRLEVCSY